MIDKIEKMFAELNAKMGEILDIVRTLKKAGRKPQIIANDAKKARQTLQEKILNAVRDIKTREVSVRDLFRKGWLILDKRASTQDVKDACYALDERGLVSVEKKGTKIMVSYVAKQNKDRVKEEIEKATKELNFILEQNTEQEIKTTLQKDSEDLAKMLEPGPERPEQQEAAIDTNEASKTFQDDPGQAIPAKTTEDSTLTKTSTTEAINDFDDFYDFI